MKKSFLILFLLSFHFAFAGTGSANDVTVIYLIIAAILAIILGVYFIIGFIRRFIENRKEKQASHHAHTQIHDFE